MDITEAYFREGERYENRRGPFEVLKIEGDSMRIRWDDGLEASTTIEDQTRIIQNMERELQGPRSGRGKKRGVPAWFGESFTGLRDADFSEDVTGTYWRSREQLGGAVTKGIAAAEPFISWAPYKMPQVHWSSLKRYKAVDSHHQSKFFARAFPDHMLFGLYVERSGNPADPRQDWTSFLKWLGRGSNAAWLSKTLLEHDAALVNPHNDGKRRAFEGTMLPREGGFEHLEGGASRFVAASDTAVYFSELPEDLWLDLYLARRMPKEEAISQGPNLAVSFCG